MISMHFYIDTTQRDTIILGLDDKRKSIRVEGISELLLPELQKFLRAKKVKLAAIKKISVNPGPGGFSSTRTGVATANALAFALGLRQEVVLPKYDKAPNITQPKYRKI